MASSRIFVKNLPPNISEENFKKHFGVKQTTTDAKLISNRRIGYVGYKTPEDALKAVVYFNKSYIRMCKISVELARPIAEASLPISGKILRDKRIHDFGGDPTDKAESTLKTSISEKKRKRQDIDNADPKLREFLQVMQSKGDVKNLGDYDEDASAEPPRKIQAVESPREDSDGEYQDLSKSDEPASQLTRREPSPAPRMPSEDLSDQPTERNQQIDIDANDDDWLRGRTNRLLDLVDQEDLPFSPPTTKAQVSDQVQKPGKPMEDVEEQSAETQTARPEAEPMLEQIRASGRLFVRNLPYSASEEEFEQYFKAYGPLEEVILPIDSSGKSKGFGLIQYSDPASATEAYQHLDTKPFQGRLLHILPADAKRDSKLDDFAISKLPLKRQKQIKRKAEASLTNFNWNSLYMNQDAVNTSVASRLGVSKAELLDPTSADAGVKQALAETALIQETKSYFAKHGVDLNAFKNQQRGDTVILAKNFPFGMSLDGLRKTFEEHGQVLQVLMPPAGTIAIVEFSQAAQARAAFSTLAYRRIEDSVLFLEKAPKDLFSGKQAALILNDHKSSNSNLFEDTEVDSSTLFVRNLNFATTSERLMQIFKPLEGFMSARVTTKTDPKKPGQVLSMGFGFVEFRSKAQARIAMKAMDGYNLDGHEVLIKASHKGQDAAQERRREDRAKKLAGRRTKIIIKNLPFEATKKDVRSLFSAYGQLRSVRVPQKFDRSARGFAFADFTTAREAENALEALRDTHLLGRRLVLEFASADALDPEEEIEKMQKKVGNQADKVALQNLIGGGRKKFHVEGNDLDEG